jgi:GNAT superfamily N-acetyltransferase
MKVTVKPTKRLILIDELNEKHFPGNPIKFSDRKTFFLAKSGSEVIGWCGYTLLPYGVAEIYRTGVLYDFRNMGVKKKLVKAMERHAVKQGATLMQSYCSTDNMASANSLISSGYKLYMPEVYDEGDHRDWLCWRKKIK